jgi:hypothetical protein
LERWKGTFDPGENSGDQLPGDMLMAAIAVSPLIASAGIYYAFFGCFFVSVAGVA